MDVYVDEQVVSEVAMSLTDGNVAAIVGLDSAEDERDFLAALRLRNCEPAVGLFDDGRPARLSEPELEEAVVCVTEAARRMLRSSFLIETLRSYLSAEAVVC